MKVTRPDVTIAGHEAQGADAVAGVNGQQSVETASDRVDGDRLGAQSGPLIPDRMAAAVAGVIGFSRLLGCVRGGARLTGKAARQGPGAGEVIVQRRSEWVANRDRDGGDVVRVV